MGWTGLNSPIPLVVKSVGEQNLVGKGPDPC